MFVLVRREVMEVKSSWKKLQEIRNVGRVKHKVVTKIKGVFESLTKVE